LALRVLAKCRKARGIEGFWLRRGRFLALTLRLTRQVSLRLRAPWLQVSCNSKTACLAIISAM
jgi:hypothetical protein